MVLKALAIPTAPEKTPTDWALPEWDSFIERRGLKFDLYRAHRCGCRNRRTHQPDYVCPLCLNRGDTLDLLGEFPVLINIAGMRTGLETSGIWEIGEATVTFKRDVNVDEGDALVYKNYTNRKSEIVRATGSMVERLKFNFATSIQRVSYIKATDVARIRDLDEEIRGGEATAAEKTEREILARELEVLLQENVDFKLINAGNRSFIQFFGAKQPDEGAAVSVLYLHNPELIVKGLPTDDIDIDVKIVQHRSVVRRDMTGDEESQTPSASPEKPTS